ncbi:hypothetical protein [Paracoccus aminophilus]|uniref:Sulfotransferase family protein n=1 Tax=Paracoccus aminophilus JCM 7686 TaxID=1367847 RepID=S5YW76_PARAH|nr:hypothetical protein [Paracoccus aminophilus]AGT09486.1 hypothetical protein JCM7686_2418 [Paracoccus aminophilus JCM 7686]
MTLYIHIGAQKTGSTTIQAALAANREALQAHGLIYPEVEENDPNKVSHYNSLRSFFSQSDVESAALNPFVQRINKLKGNVLISAEALSNWPRLRPQEAESVYWQRKRAALVKLRAALAAEDVKIVMCMRERASYLKSLFKQHLKIFKRPSISIDEMLADFLRHEIYRSNLVKQRAAWAEIFGEVRTIDFDAHQDGSLIPAFMRAVDCSFVPREVEIKNVSPSWADLEKRRMQVTLGLNAEATIDPAKSAEYSALIEQRVCRRITAAIQQAEKETAAA